MGNNIKKCYISRYDKSITEPPYLTIKFDEVEIEAPLADNLGETFAKKISEACIAKGYIFKFYTSSGDDRFDFEIVVV